MIGRDDPRLRDRDAIAGKLAEAARAAATVLLQKRAAYEVRLKTDGSPVCTADLAADHAAKAALARLAPGFPVVSEETVESVEPGPVFILLDPLDGTREFLAGATAIASPSPWWWETVRWPGPSPRPRLAGSGSAASMPMPRISVPMAR